MDEIISLKGQTEF